MWDQSIPAVPAPSVRRGAATAGARRDRPLPSHPNQAAAQSCTRRTSDRPLTTSGDPKELGSNSSGSAANARPTHKGHLMIIAIGLYQGFTTLDAIGPYEVLTYLPGAEMFICAEQTGVVDDHNDLVHLRVDATFADVPRPDVLLVPGGPGAGRYAAEGHPIVDWIRQAHPHTTWTTSVCTGALLLGAAGLLDGLPATTHWSAYDELASYGAQPTEQRVVTAGKIVTGAGVSAGIDLALTLAAK